ncbi:PsiF family protein [Stenotrophomonas indicatrix]|nr:PsiF family protein [Stenotrophomonas indicatrix]MCR8714754.1 PsiF family protein [Stenotrophomonas indicatrix]
MKASLLLAAALLVGLPIAANAATPQQQRMAEHAGDARKTFMSSCLKAS